MATEKRVKLKGGLKHTASSAEIAADGTLVIELYDFSNDAESAFGNDVAFQLKVSRKDKTTMLEKLATGGLTDPEMDSDDQLLQRIRDHFDSYYDVQKWLQENSIPFDKQFDSWA